MATALLVMDLQHGVADGFADGGVLDRAASALAAAPEHGVPVVFADACADADPEVHRVVLEKVFPRQAEVPSVAAWAVTLGTPSSPEAGGRR